jgi:hypothetical protein
VRGQKRPTTERTRALAIVATTGNTEEAARQTGVPGRTIRDWIETEEFAELRQRTKDEFAEELWAGVQHGFRVVVRELDGPAPLRDKALATAILFDKLALVRGEATIRTESRDLNGFDDHELAALRSAIAAGVPGPESADQAEAPVDGPRPT